MLIAIDHGNKQMKTVNCPPFVSGLAESSTKPFGSNILMYRDRFYTLSNQRIPYKRDKTEDDRFFILTLFGIAQELQAKGIYGEMPQRIRLAVGLPPAHYGAQHQAFIRYFSDRGVVKFNYRGKNHAVYIEDVRCYPQAYAAAVTMMDRLVESPKVLIVDIGGFTADYLMMRSGRADLAVRFFGNSFRRTEGKAGGNQRMPGRFCLCTGAAGVYSRVCGLRAGIGTYGDA